MMTEVCGANNCIAMDSRNFIVVVIDMRMFYFMMRRKLLHRIEQCVWSYQSYDDGGMWWYQSGDDVCLPKCVCVRSKVLCIYLGGLSST